MLNVDDSEEDPYLWLILIPNLIPPKHSMQTPLVKGGGMKFDFELQRVGNEIFQ